MSTQYYTRTTIDTPETDPKETPVILTTDHHHACDSHEAKRRNLSSPPRPGRREGFADDYKLRHADDVSARAASIDRAVPRGTRCITPTVQKVTVLGSCKLCLLTMSAIPHVCDVYAGQKRETRQPKPGTRRAQSSTIRTTVLPIRIPVTATRYTHTAVFIVSFLFRCP